jgi:hypothetical protein
MERAKADAGRIAKQQAIVNKLKLQCIASNWGPPGGVYPYLPPGSSYTLYADLGIPKLGDRDLPDSSQFVVNDGDFSAGLGGTFDIPSSLSGPQQAFWWTLGWYFTYIRGTPTSVENVNLPGSLAVHGYDKTWAGFLTAGGRWRPFTGTLSPLEVMGLVGLGLASNRVSLLGTGGNELLSSRLTSFAWMTRLALNYWLTDHFALGVFVTYLAAQNATALLSNGTTVPYGRSSSLVTGFTLSISFGDDDGLNDVRSRYATPNR